jgi:DNA-binding LacI/PurR family transcriptional regulator
MDVARTCGLSKTTVSVILNKTPASERVPHDTQQRVRLAAERLGYRPNWRARALASRRTHTIGVLYAPPMPLIVRGNYEGIIAGINETLHGRGYHMMFVPLGENPADWGRILLDQRMDGALVLSRLREPLADVITEARLPIALVNADTDLNFPLVIVDDYDGALQNTRHLLSLGHRNIAFLIGPQPPHYSVHQRQDGYQAAMRDAGADKYIRVINSTPDEFVRQFRDDPNRPTGVVVYTHYMAVNLLRVLWEQGLGVPKDLSVVTFTNAFPVEDVIPPLTTIALPTEEMGRAAAKMVLDQIETGGPPPKRRLVLKETLIVRKSTAPVTG